MIENPQDELLHYRGRLSEFKQDKRALLVGIYQRTEEKEICFEHLEELDNLCETYGIETVDRMCCPIKKFETATFIGTGKTEEIAEMCQEKNINLVVFDDEIVPHQQRNLEKIFQTLVIDRTELILGVFEKRAHSRDAKIQIELAQMRYQLPRLKRMWTHLSRQRTKRGGGKGGYLKGEGERQIEIDRRIVKRRIHRLEDLLKNVKKNRDVQRAHREKSGIPTFAIIGYTNAGKSTLLNALTDADVFIEDRLFATLDTTTRKFTLPNSQNILLIDTIGFIRKIPHLLVATFKSTLEEATKADILIHMVDVSDEQAEEKLKASYEVLQELNADEKPTITCLNKIDKCEDKERIFKLKLSYPYTIEISALEKTGFDELIQMMIKMVSLLRKRMQLRIPQSEYGLVSEIMKIGQVFSCDYEENDVILDAEVPHQLEKKLSRYSL